MMKVFVTCICALLYASCTAISITQVLEDTSIARVTKVQLEEALELGLINDERLVPLTSIMDSDAFDFYYANAIINKKEEFTKPLYVREGVTDLFIRNAFANGKDLSGNDNFWRILHHDGLKKLAASPERNFLPGFQNIEKSVFDKFVIEIRKIPDSNEQNETMKKILSVTGSKAKNAICSGDTSIFPALDFFCNGNDLADAVFEPNELIHEVKRSENEKRGKMCAGITISLATKFAKDASLEECDELLQLCSGENFLPVESVDAIIFSEDLDFLNLKNIDLHVFRYFISESFMDVLSFPPELVNLLKDLKFRKLFNRPIAVVSLNKGNIWETADGFSEEVLEVFLKYKQFTDAQLMASNRDSDSNLYKVLSKNNSLVSPQLLADLGIPVTVDLGIPVTVDDSHINVGDPVHSIVEDGKKSDDDKNPVDEKKSKVDGLSEDDGDIFAIVQDPDNSTTSLDDRTVGEIKTLNPASEIISSTPPIDDSHSSGHSDDSSQNRDIKKSSSNVNAERNSSVAILFAAAAFIAIF